MYKCLECGEVFEDNYPYYDMPKCPHCNGETEYAYQCEICGEYFTNDELDNDVCCDCIEKVKEKYNDIDKMYNATVDNDDLQEDVKISEYLMRFFSKEDIEKVLLNCLKENQKLMPVMIEERTEEYADNIADYLVEDYLKGAK